MKKLMCVMFLLAVSQWGLALGTSVPNDASKTCPIKVGESIPALTLKDLSGKPFDINKAIADKPSIIIFYRGGWCPYCNVHLGELKTIEPELKSLGYQIIAISPDSPSHLAETVDKNEITYQLLSDDDAKAIKALGLAYRVDDDLNKKLLSYDIDIDKASGKGHRILPVPAALVVDTKGVVRFNFSSPDYKVRVEKTVLLAAAKASVN